MSQIEIFHDAEPLPPPPPAPRAPSQNELPLMATKGATTECLACKPNPSMTLPRRTAKANHFSRLKDSPGARTHARTQENDNTRLGSNRAVVTSRARGRGAAAWEWDSARAVQRYLSHRARYPSHS